MYRGEDIWAKSYNGRVGAIGVAGARPVILSEFTRRYKKIAKGQRRSWQMR